MSDIINKVSWTELKAFTDARDASIQWRLTNTNDYLIYAVDGPYTYSCIIPFTAPANAEQTDFETNYKPSGNQVFKNFAYTGDRLKVDTIVTRKSATTLRYDIMNVSTGGVVTNAAIGSTFTDVYNQTGSGLIYGFNLTLERLDDPWEIRFVVDSTNIFTLNSEILQDDRGYNYEDLGEATMHGKLGLSLTKDTLVWEPPLNTPLTYSTRIQVQVRYLDGGTKKFRAGFVVRTV